TTLEDVTVAALKASAAVISISAVSGTPSAPFAGVIVADSTWPTTLRFTVAVWLAVTWAVAVPARAVLGIEAVRCAVPAAAAIVLVALRVEKATKGKASV